MTKFSIYMFSGEAALFDSISAIWLAIQMTVATMPRILSPET